MPLEKLDPSAFIELFRTRAQQALNAGFYGASFVVEMVWTVELDVAHDALIEVETRLNSEFFPNSPALAICIYEPQRLSAEYLLGALRSHPLAIIDGTLISDPFYQPPEQIAQPSPSARVDWMITQLARWVADREEFRRSHDRFRALIENASDGITVLDSDGLILYEGPSVERLLGYKPEEVEGRPVAAFIRRRMSLLLSIRSAARLKIRKKCKQCSCVPGVTTAQPSSSRRLAGDCRARSILHVSSSTGAISASGFGTSENSSARATLPWMPRVSSQRSLQTRVTARR
jgi:PAS domain-containing protein